MSSGPSSLNPACTGGAACTAETDYTPGSTIIATQHRRFRELMDLTYNGVLRTVAHLRPLIRLSKYGLGICLILCVTVIWVASSVWIQYIFGSLEFNRPFFLTYLNTTGFCLWNFGFCVSARWRRTQWDEASRAQPVCVEDERLDLWMRSWTEESKAQETVHDGGEGRNGEKNRDVQGRGKGLPVGTGVGAAMLRVDRGAVRGTSPHGRTASGVSLALSDAAPQGLLIEEDDRHPSLNQCLPSSFLPPDAESYSMQPPPYGSGHPLRSSTTAERMLSSEAPSSAPFSRLHGVVSDRYTTKGVFPDNDNADDGRDGGRVDSEARPASRLHFADECRDYSLSSSLVSSAREEMVSVTLADEDENVHVGPRHDSTRQGNVIPSSTPHHSDAVGPWQHRRRRARRQRIRRYSLRRIWRCALFFCPLWFLANYFFNLSLSITSVASTTILSSTSSIWTFLLSYMLLQQPLQLHRFVAIALSVSGTIVVGLTDKGANSGHSVLGGNIAALLSALFYAMYTSVLKLHLPDDERFSMGMLFGAVGVLNLFLLWPGLVLLSVTGTEPFAWPSWKQFWFLLLNSLVGTNLSDVLWARSVVLTSPVVATLGLSLTTPLSMVVDILFKRAHFSGAYVAGAILIMAGFLLANVSISVNRIFMCAGAHQDKAA
ncbi:hypothetical protein JKF63_06404 [Porcisia hertigi]|uniref:Sugar phosphate transporter domain-containing protein n=1 Tax=Porcisia hertigi TaxID=2761500 RepID=A0A837A953_9TRYP|nr:hypothetical protein JKF63_06404 [Porcisia hertigi]